MIVIGVVLLVLGLLLGFGLLTTVGLILLVIGAVLMLMGHAGRGVGGRSHWY